MNLITAHLLRHGKITNTDTTNFNSTSSNRICRFVLSAKRTQGLADRLIESSCARYNQRIQLRRRSEGQDFAPNLSTCGSITERNGVDVSGITKGVRSIKIPPPMPADRDDEIPSTFIISEMRTDFDARDRRHGGGALHALLMSLLKESVRCTTDLSPHSELQDSSPRSDVVSPMKSSVRLSGQHPIAPYRKVRYWLRVSLSGLGRVANELVQRKRQKMHIYAPLNLQQATSQAGGVTNPLFGRSKRPTNKY